MSTTPTDTTGNGTGAWLTGPWRTFAQLGAIGIVCLMCVRFQEAFLAQGRDDRKTAQQELNSLRERLDTLHEDSVNTQGIMRDLGHAVRDSSAEVKKLRLEIQRVARNWVDDGPVAEKKP